MKIQYDCTLKEATDDHMRFLKKSETAKRQKWRGLLFTPVLFILFYVIHRGDQGEKLIFASITGLLYLGLYLSSYNWLTKRRVRKFLLEYLGTDQPVPCEIEFTDQALIFRRKGTEISLKWDAMKELIENDKDTEFIFDGGGFSVIHDEVFADASQKEEWLNFAKGKTGRA